MGLNDIRNWSIRSTVFRSVYGGSATTSRSGKSLWRAEIADPDRRARAGRGSQGCLLLTSLLAGLISAGGMAIAAPPTETSPPPRTPASDTPASATEAEHANYVEPALTPGDFDHWSLRPLQSPSVPRQTGSAWCRNEIDHFVLQALRAEDLQPQPAASPATLSRRVCLDVTGLLPELAAHGETVASPVTGDQPAADPSTRLNQSQAPEQPAPEQQARERLAYERRVDLLLQSTAYGERQAQFWLDLARFAETDGFEHDRIRPEAWRYRDWVIQSFNDDLPYDQFLRQQIAGDLLTPDDPDAAVATHFCVCGPDMPDINLQSERRHMLLNEITSTVGAVVLGLQVGCAQCHDHKYDPVSQADFYRLRSYFEPAVQLQKNVSVTGLQQGRGTQTPSHLMLRGDFRRPGPELQPGVVRVANAGRWQLARAGDSVESETTGVQSGSDRIALVNWLTSDRNPLTARVIANRIWQQHFGRGLSETPSDFGVMGQEPTHPELLDWLACWLIDHDWSLKQLHRLILCSATYQQCSMLPESSDEARQTQWSRSLEQDPDCRLLSRFPRQRLQGETIRDVMLQTAGLLSRGSGGPGVRPPLPAELSSTLLKDQWTVTSDVREHDRRSIYVFARRNMRYPIFEVFDRPPADQSCAVRSVSTTATQALHLMNSEFSLRVATEISRQIQKADDPVTRAFQQILRRSPAATEKHLVTRMFSAQGPLNATELQDLCLCLLNSNEFVTLD